MSYNIASSGTLNAAASNLKIASDSCVSYTPDYQKLVISGDGNTYGICYADFTVDSGGYLDMSNRAYVSALTVLSGGTAIGASWGKWKDLTVSAGGSVTFYAAKLYGSNYNIAKGAITNCATAYAVGSTFYDFDTTLGFDVYDNITFSNCKLGGTVCVMTDGATMRDITVTGGTLYAYNGGQFYNITATAGNFRMNNYWVNFTIGGSKTEIAAGHWFNNPELYITGGVIYNMNLRKEGSSAQKVTLAEGIVANAPVVGDSGVLTIRSTASAAGAVIRSNGNLYVSSAGEVRDTVLSNSGTMYLSSGAKSYDAVVSDGGKLIVSFGAVASGITVSNGGSAAYVISGYTRPDIIGLTVESGGKATAENYVPWRSLDVRSGGSFSCANVKIYGGDINIASGAWVNCPSAYVSNAVITNYSGTLSFDVYSGAGFSSSILGQYAWIYSGATATDVTVANGGTLYVSYGAATDGITVENGGKAYYNASGYNRPDINNLVISSGGVVIADGYCGWHGIDASAGATLSAVNAKIHGPDINIASGAWVNCPTAYAINGVIYDLDTTSGGNGIDLYGSAVVSNAKLGGYTYLFSGAQARDAELTNAARGLEIRSGCYGYNINATVGKIYFGEYWTNVSLGGADTEIAAGHVFYNGAGAATAPDADLYATNGVLHNLTVRGEGAWMRDVTLVEGITAAAPVVSGGLFTVGSGATASDLVVSSGTAKITAGGVIDGVDVLDGAFNLFDDPEATGTVRDAIVAENVRVSGGQAFVRGSNALGSNYTVLNGLMYVQNGATADGIEIAGGTVSAYVNNNELCVDYDADDATVENVILTTGNLNIGDRGIADGVAVAGGSMSVNTSGAAMDVEQTGGRIIVNGSGATIDGATVYGGNMSIGNGGALNDATISGGTVVVRHVAGWAATTELKSAVASDVRVETGAGLTLESGGILQAGKLADGATLTVYKGGQAGLASAAAGATINLNFWDVNSGATGNEHGLISEWGDFSSGAKVNVQSIDFGGTSYKIADEANANVTLDVIGYHDIYQIAVKSGQQHSNAFWGMNFDFSDGMTLATNTFSVGVEATAAALGTGTATALADGGFAAIWTANTDTSGVSVVADADTTGDAWVTVNGASLATPLYGAQGNFAHDVNMWIYEGTVRNLAAGATAGGSVENVNLLISDNGEGTDKLTFTGVAYLGGFGSVTGEVTAAVYGGSYDKDFYAGALANKLDAQTAVGSVNLTVKSGKFSGNIYGGSAVKTDTTVGNGTRNTTGDITLTVTGGETTKGAQACIFAGGYATGDATGTVYTVDSVTATISGGSWGTACGGRGVFGGIMASGVTAQVIGDVNLTVSGGTMGNVYGGGWAQKTNGKSIVGNVSIDITGGTIANVFGGGSHSTSGGSTTAGDVTITVSGGNITGAIYARGQLDGDTTGAANVIFTGTTDFSCDVFGYSYVGGEASDATLAFSTYAGEFSGSIGGFNSVTFADGTAMTLATAAGDVSNGAWNFDLTDRASSLAGTSLLTWSTADFENDTVRVSFADDAQAQGGWNIAAVAEAFSGTTFDIEVGESQIATGLAYNQQIASGDYQGWGFTLDEGVLKFKNLA